MILALLVTLSIWDARTCWIPLFLNIPLLFVVTGDALFRKSWLYILPEAVVGFLFFFLVRKMTRNGIGLGDAILSASMAVLLGIRHWLWAVSVGCLLALLYAIIMIIGKQDKS